VFCAQVGRAAAPALSEEALARLVRHAWPGNIRELRNVVQRAVLLAGPTTIEAEHLALGPDAATAPDASALAETRRGRPARGDLASEVCGELEILEREHI